MSCEQCGKQIEISGFCSMKCRNLYVNNPERMALIKRAKRFRQNRVGLITPEENMADFAAAEMSRQLAQPQVENERLQKLEKVAKEVYFERHEIFADVNRYHRLVMKLGRYTSEQAYMEYKAREKAKAK